MHYERTPLQKVEAGMWLHLRSTAFAELRSATAAVGGTINGTGSFVMKAERVGADTLLAQIVKMVSEAQRTRAPIQRLADIVASYFVPAVVAASVITFAVWAIFGPPPHYAHALVNAVAVLIIACPCALGLATPMAIMVGTGRGAREGILIRNAEALEIFGKVDTPVVDTTETKSAVGRQKTISSRPNPPPTPFFELLLICTVFAVYLQCDGWPNSSYQIVSITYSSSRPCILSSVAKMATLKEGGSPCVKCHCASSEPEAPRP
jgi:hypothetical protein